MTIGGAHGTPVPGALGLPATWSTGHPSPGALGCHARHWEDWGNHPQSIQDSHYWEHSGAHQWGHIATEQFLPLKEKRGNWKPARRQQKAPLHTGTAPNGASHSINAQGVQGGARAHLTCHARAGLTDRAHVRQPLLVLLGYLPGAQLLPCLPRHNRSKERLSALNYEPIAFSLERLSMEKS